MAFAWFNTLRKYLGWCPRAQIRMRNADVLTDDRAVVPPESGAFKDRAVQWLNLFRNQIMLLAIGTSFAGVYLFAGLGGVSRPDLFFLGILAGLPLSAVVGFLYWRIFDEVVRDGPVVLLNRFDKASGILAVATAVIILYGQVYFLTGPAPWFDATMPNAFFGGFIGTLFWGLLISAVKWESDTRRRLQYDGMILMLEKD